MTTVVVAGGTSDIGLSTARLLSSRGWTVISTASTSRSLEQHADLAPDSHWLVVDVTKPLEVEALRESVYRRSSGLDAVVNCVGVAEAGTVELSDDEHWNRILEVNLLGAVRLTRCFIEPIIRSSGRFVHIGSIGGRLGVPLWGANTASRHALSGFNWALRMELHTSGAYSVVVEPGLVQTRLLPRAEASLAQCLSGQGEAAAKYASIQAALLRQGARPDRGIPPEDVARAVHKALTVRKPRARYVVGREALLAAYLCHLPDGLREALMRRAILR